MPGPILFKAGLALLLLLAGAEAFAATPLVVAERPVRGGFPLAADGGAAIVQHDPDDHPVVASAAQDLAGDIAAVTGVRPWLAARPTPPAGPRVVLIGTLGRNRAIDTLVRGGRLDIAGLRGAWESFVIAVVHRPVPGVESALVIAGSDPRGTAFGVYELTEAIGVSPWNWWADVPAHRRAALWLEPGVRRFGPPSVKYRGIFINDEDWGLHPWAANTHEPGAGGLGPKSYRRVFELLLRLKANSLWPAMHKVSPPFNANPENPRLADRYAIVMGSSHAEPMLRNNVGEWKEPGERFNYADNRERVRAYWEQRVRENAPFESLWTIGMRGIHDSGIVGAATTDGKIRLLEQAIDDQRKMLAQHVRPDITTVPQMFMPYKEVLALYRAGLPIPADVTIVWPDDNFGYIRQFPDAAERARRGGSGIYYHLSYLGAPLSYLWLSTTPPALINEEMTRAWDAGARTLWIANVGDIKPAEIGTSLFLEMAWDVERWRGRSQSHFLKDWSTRTFGRAQGTTIGSVLDEHFALNWERRPEHLQFWLPGERPRHSALSELAITDRLNRFDRLTDRLASISIAPAQADAFFQLVDYPVRAAADANRRYFGAERYARLIDSRPADARAAAASASAANARIKALTHRFNEEVAGGKWRHLIAEEPADNQWARFRIAPLAIPAPGLGAPMATPLSTLVERPEPCSGAAGPLPKEAVGWRTHQGLGRGGRALVAAKAGARLRINVDVPPGCGLALGLVPTFPTAGTSGFVVSIASSGDTPTEVRIAREADTPAWAQGVLDNRLLVPVPASAAGDGRARLVLSVDQPGLALDQMLLVPAPPDSGKTANR